MGVTLRRGKGRCVWLVRFWHNGRTIERSTGERERELAQKKAKEIVAETISGRERAVRGDLVPALAQFLDDYRLSHAPKTSDNVAGYLALFADFFRDLSRLTPQLYAEYMRARIQCVTRTTLRKELSALRLFAQVASAPPVPSLPKGGFPGVRASNARRRVATILTPAEVELVLAQLPIVGPRSKAWIRPFFEIVWETGLRPYSTVAKLEAPLHFRHGAERLFISREIDKARYERLVPLTTRAREALDLVCPREGKLFPRRGEHREALDRAVAAAGIARRVSIYDFRHSRISQLANSGRPLAGVAYLVGHRHISTTALYVQTSIQAAEEALAGALTGAP